MFLKPDLSTFSRSLGAGRPEGAEVHTHRPRHLLGLQPERRALRGRSARRPAPPAGAAEELGYTLKTGPELEFFLFARERRPIAAAAARPRRLLRLLHRPRLHRPQGHGERARGDGDRRRGQPPRGRHRPARDRLRVRRRPPHRRPRRHLQVHAEGDRPAARPARHLHAEADRRHQRLRHARPPEPLGLDQKRQERLRRPERPLRAVRRSPSTSSPASSPTRAACRRARAAGQLVPAPGAGLRGAGLRLLGAHQPLGADPRPADPRRPAPPRPASSCAARIRPATRTWPSR